MSRNFDVLFRLQQDRELFQVPPVMKNLPGDGRRTNGNVSLPDLDGFARDEILRLVQCLFLATNGNGERSRRQVVFCGIDEADGSHSLCAGVARCLAEEVPSQVCVVDANLRGSARSSELFPSDSLPLSEGGTTHKLMRRVTENLWFASRDSAAKNGGLPTLEQVGALTRDLRDEFTYVVISAPPVGLYSDAAFLGQMADGVVLVLEANSTRRVAARKAQQKLEGANVQVLGTVLNNRTFPIPEKIYHRL
jgi:Mrp family chromosome partitioning ATPase